MSMFEGKCPGCGKKVYLNHPDGVVFCSKACETNWRYEKEHMVKR